MKTVIIAFLVNLLALSPPNYSDLYYQGSTLFKNKDFKKAASKFEDAYKLKAHWQIAYYAAYSFYKSGDQTKCKFYTEASLASSPRPTGEYLENLVFFQKKLSGSFSSTTQTFDFTLQDKETLTNKDTLKKLKQAEDKAKKDKQNNELDIFSSYDQSQPFNSSNAPKEFFRFFEYGYRADSVKASRATPGKVTFPIDSLKAG